LSKIATTTKDIGLLLQLRDDNQLTLAPEFQRNAVWSRPAKAYLIDTILTDNPIPVLYFQRVFNAQTNRVEFSVVDGQQRLNAIFDFLDNRYSLTASDPDSPWYRKRWKALDPVDREKILAYDLVIQELSGFTEEKIREMFVRMNKYVVSLNPQELRRAGSTGPFRGVVEELGRLPFWIEQKVVSPGGQARMKQDEFAAELMILLNEGPQDKKESVDLYYADRDGIGNLNDLAEELKQMLLHVQRILPDLKSTMYRKPANLYALVGALLELQADTDIELPADEVLGERLRAFEKEVEKDEEFRSTAAQRYWVAQSRQTDNLRPRRSRIDLLREVLLPGVGGSESSGF